MRYYTTKCPNCNYVLESHNSRHSNIQPDILPCPKCRKFFKTGYHLWDDMNDDEKFGIYFKKIITLIFGTIVWGLIASSIINEYIKNAELYVNIASFTFFGIVGTLVTISDIRAIKKLSLEDFMMEYWEKYDKYASSDYQIFNDFCKKNYNKSLIELEKEIFEKDKYDYIKYLKINEQIVIVKEYLNGKTDL